MGSVGQPPAVLGGMIGSALVGTFLGILLAYAFAEPLAGLLEQKVEDGGKELQCIKTTLLASMQGYAPQVAIEFGRKVLYSTDRPTFAELEEPREGQEVMLHGRPAFAMQLSLPFARMGSPRSSPCADPAPPVAA